MHTGGRDVVMVELYAHSLFGSRSFGLHPACRYLEPISALPAVMDRSRANGKVGNAVHGTGTANEVIFFPKSRFSACIPLAEPLASGSIPEKLRDGYLSVPLLGGVS